MIIRLGIDSMQRLLTKNFVTTFIIIIIPFFKSDKGVLYSIICLKF